MGMAILKNVIQKVDNTRYYGTIHTEKFDKLCNIVYDKGTTDVVQSRPIVRVFLERKQSFFSSVLFLTANI